jgi:hypothetical protein
MRLGTQVTTDLAGKPEHADNVKELMVLLSVPLTNYSNVERNPT